MSESIESVVYSWLQSLQIPIDREYLENRITSHPDYPSALCITSVLDELGIQNATVEVDRDQLKDITFPILIFAKGRFHLWENPSKQVDSPILEKQPTVVILVAEKPDKLNKPELLLSAEKDSGIFRVRWITLVAVLSGIILMSSLAQFTIANLLLMCLSIAGVLITFLMVLNELGFSNKTIQKVCGKGSASACNKVLHSKGATVGLHVKWSDVGFGFFLGMIVLLFGKSFGTDEFNSACSTTIAWVAMAGIPFIVYSIYYQWKVVKEWCRLCLVALGLLIAINCVTFARSSYEINSGLLSISSAICIFAIPGLIWLVIRAILEGERKLYNTNIQLQRITRNAEIFHTYIQSQRKVDSTPWPHDILLGNADAKIQILAVCNPYCSPCALAHESLDKLLSTMGDLVGITFRFTCSDDGNDEGTKVVTHFLRFAFEDDRYIKDQNALRNLLNSWFHDFDVKQLEKMYPVSKSRDVSYYTGMHWRWCEEADIAHTPTIFVNGHELVMPYTVIDLSSIIRASKEMHTANESMSQTII